MLESLTVGEMHHHKRDFTHWMEQAGLGLESWMLWSLNTWVHCYGDLKPYWIGSSFTWVRGRSCPCSLAADMQLNSLLLLITLSHILYTKPSISERKTSLPKIKKIKYSKQSLEGLITVISILFLTKIPSVKLHKCLLTDTLLHHVVHNEGEFSWFPRFMASADCLRQGSSWQSPRAKNWPLITNHLGNGLQSDRLRQSTPPSISQQV